MLRISQSDVAQLIIENLACGIFSTMGFGKTGATITAVETLFRRKEIKKLLIVSTILVVENTWPEEIEAWEHTSNLTFGLIRGDADQRLKAARGRDQIHLINQENFVWLVQRAGRTWPYDMIIFDDSQGFKTSKHKTRPSKAICALAAECPIYMHDKGSRACSVICELFKSPPRGFTRFGALCAIRSKVKRLVHLTGTPSTKGLLDLWPMLFTMDHGARLGKTYTQYKDRYFNRGHNGFGYHLREGAAEKIHAKIGDICAYIESEAVLPKLTTVPYPIKLPKDAAKMYDEFERDLLINLDENTELEAANNGVLAGKLLQVCGGAVYYDEAKNWKALHNEKIKALVRIMTFHPGEPILIGYNFKHELERLRARFPQGIDIRDRKDAVHAWNAGEIPIMFAHPGSAGHGLNLQLGPGRVLVWFGLNWRLDYNNQLNKRLHRPGQKRECFIYYLIAEGRADTILMEGVARYDWTQTQLLEAVKRQATNRKK